MKARPAAAVIAAAALALTGCASEEEPEPVASASEATEALIGEVTEEPEPQTMWPESISFDLPEYVALQDDIVELAEDVAFGAYPLPAHHLRGHRPAR